MADPPDDDDWMADFSEDEKAQADAARERIHRDNPTVVQFDPKRKRKGGGKPPTPPPGGYPSWRDKLRKDNGRIIPDLANVLMALRAEPALAFAVAFHEMRGRALVTMPWPRAPGAEPGAPVPHELTEDDTSRLQEWLQHMALPKIGRETVTQAIEVFARERPVHPLRDWLNGLEWDETPRIGTWLAACLGCPDDDYHVRIGTMALLAMVARVFKPGCKSDYLLVLEGPQGEEKSKFCKALAGEDEYFSDHLPRIDGDEIRVSMHLAGKWIVEVAELSAILKADPETAKHFFSRTHERYTPKFGRAEVNEPRQCFFIGTTNDNEYIRDATGGRRFWPVKVVKINLQALVEMRPQLFAEAVALYNQGERWWPDRAFEKTVIAPVQDERQWEDAWTDRVMQHLEGKRQTTIAELAQLMGVETARLDRIAQNRLAAILRQKAGWVKGFDHGKRKVWRNPE
jgi:predicted P-loop ATPase